MMHCLKSGMRQKGCAALNCNQEPTSQPIVVLWHCAVVCAWDGL
jgi:hypothetical protein